jgi:hypothetical protein
LNVRNVKTNKRRGNRIKATKSLLKTTAASSFWMFRRRTKSASLLASKSLGRKGPKGTTCRIIKRAIVHFFTELDQGHLHPLHRASKNVVSQVGIEPKTSAAEHSMQGTIQMAN